MFGINIKKNIIDCDELSESTIKFGNNFSFPASSKCIYTKNYCEENVWHLCKGILENVNYNGECYVVFVSNPIRSVGFSNHKICGRDGIVFWDYHVFAICGLKKVSYVVLDLDTILPFPSSFNFYCKHTFEINKPHPGHERYFRVIPADVYISNFSSDRRHMRKGDIWQSEPPAYLPIRANDVDHNLDDFINMVADIGFGHVMNYEKFVKNFST